MIRFACHAGLFLLANLAVGLGLLALHDLRLDFAPWETDSALLRMPRGADARVILLGSSRAQLLSRHAPHHQAFETAAGGKVISLALPAGGGVRPARLLFETCLARGNRADAVVHVIEPFVFYNAGANDYHKFVYTEPLDPVFLRALLRDRYPYRRVLTYLRSKYSWHWWSQRAEPLGELAESLAPRDVTPERIADRFASLYIYGLEEERFALYANEVEAIAARCGEAGIPYLLVAPPVLLGEEPGKARMETFIAGLQDRHPHVRYIDMSQALPDPAMYTDLDHLNTAGALAWIAALGDFLEDALSDC